MQINEDQQDLEVVDDPETVWYKKYMAVPYPDVARRMLELRESKGLAEMDLANINKEIDVISKRVVPERFAEDGFTNMRIAGVGTLSITNDIYCTQKSGLQEKLFDWLREQGYGDLIKDTVNSSSLKSLVKELQKDASGAEMQFDGDGAEAEKSQFDQVSEFLNITPFMRASVTKR